MDPVTLAAAKKRLPLGRQCLEYPDHLSRWWAAVADARYDQAHMMVFGDSITRGQYSNNASSTDEATWRERGYVPQLRQLFADRYGDPGEGYIHLDDPRVTNSGGQTIISVGVAQAGKRLESGDTLTIDLPACTDITIYAWWSSNASTEQFTYTIDGGASQSSTAQDGSDIYFEEEITGLSDATHTLVITAPATGYADIAGVAAWQTPRTGVAVSRLARSGGYLDTSFISGTGTSPTRLNRMSTTQAGADLLVLAFGANESGSGQALGKTPTTFATLLEDVTTYATDTAGISALIVAGPRRDPSSVGATYEEEEYYNAARAVAAANPHVGFFDLKKAWGDFSDADGLGLMQDVVHPTRLGHSFFASLMFEALGGA